MDAPGDDGRENCTLRGRVTPSSVGLFAEDQGSWRVTSELEDLRVGGMGESGSGFRARAEREGAAAMVDGYPTWLKNRLRLRDPDGGGGVEEIDHAASRMG